MKGTGHATGGITFLNALATGIGSAAGIAIPLSASVELVPAREPGSRSIDPPSDSPLVRASLSAALRRWAPGRAFHATVAVDSEIPVARGLKSSSAVSGAVARGVAAALGVFAPSTEVARLSADVSQAIGLSATGAFDDALSALEPGVQVTDNARRARIRHDPVDPTWEVVLWIPDRPHLPSPNYREAFSRLRSSASEAEAAARRGDPLAAMAGNTLLVERALGYPYAEIRRALLRAGALGCGVSGLGPTLAVVVTSEVVSEVLKSLPPGAGDVLVTRFTSQPSLAVAGGP